MMTMAVILMKEILSELHCIYCLCMCIPYSHYQKKTKKPPQKQNFLCVVYLFCFLHAGVCGHIHRCDANCITSHTMYVDFVTYSVCHVLCTKGSAVPTTSFAVLYTTIISTMYCIHMPSFSCTHLSLLHCCLATLTTSVSKEAEPTNYRNVTENEKGSHHCI